MDYEKLMLKIKNEKFPELKNVNIHLKPWRFKFYKISFASLPPTTIYYDIQKIKKYNKKLLCAIFAHELSHLIQNKKMNWFQRIIHFVRYLIDLNYASKVEKEADRITIKRGFGADLIAARRLSNKLASKKELKKRMKIYYSPEDLKKLVHDSKK